MNKINFTNLPSTTTPLNATNLNQLQTNVDNAKVENKAISYAEDLNDLSTGGWYSVGAGATNKPDTGNYYVEVIGVSQNYFLQRATKISGSKMDTIYQRFYNNGTWKDWIDISPPKTTTNTDGTSIKFADGTMICTKTVDFTGVAVSTASGSLYRTASLSLGDYAEEFYATPTLQLTIGRGSGAGWVGNCSNNAKDHIADIIIYRSSTTSSADYHVDVTAVGRWKA